MTDSFILNKVKDHYPSVTCFKSFLKKNSRLLVALIEFESIDEYNDALENGIQIGNIF